MTTPFIVERSASDLRPDWDAKEVGEKAIGLAGLPAAWCPPFLVVTTTAYRRWSVAPTNPDSAGWLFGETGLRASIDRVIGRLPPAAKVLVRSSAPAEGLEDRGRYESAECSNRDDEIAATIARLWVESGQTSSGLALILQPTVGCVLKGHLSNERRLSEAPEDWVCEYEGDRRHRTRRIAAGDAAAPAGPLVCAERSALFRQLAAVAAGGTRVWDRIHYEWVWDGGTLWVVQQDVEEPRAGRPPGSSSQLPVLRPPLEMKVLIPSERTIGPWHKVYCSRVFQDCGLRMVPIYAIEGDAVIRGLAGGSIDPQLAEDVERLGSAPVVVRTDVDKEASFPSTLLARTDSVDALTALRFVADQAATLVSKGLKPSQFCFLLHNYITANCSSLSRAMPQSNQVTIDATWGNADGLMYYPHDTFDVSLGPRPAVQQRIRCKSRFIDCGDDGRWAEREAGTPWDWLPSLSKTDAISVARATKRIADRVGHAVEVMHFIGVEAGEVAPICLPWYFNSESKDETDPAEGLQTVSIFSKDFITIRTAEDLKREAKRAATRRPSRGCTLRLVPSHKLMRDQPFLEDVSKFAVQHRLPVRLVGSALSHVFYVLRRHGVKLKIPLPIRKRPRLQRFNKLVRDNIPKIIRGHGEAARAVRVRLADHPDLIKAKLIEEALELFWEQEPKGLRRELADVTEVVRTICKLIGVDFAEVLAEAERRRAERGGFDAGTILLETGPTLPPPKAVQLTLFDVTDDGGGADHDELMAQPPEPNQPRGTKTGLSIPLTPPDSGTQQRAYSVRSGDGRLDVIVTYSRRAVTVRPSPGNLPVRKHASRGSGGQGGLFDEAEPAE